MSGNPFKDYFDQSNPQGLQQYEDNFRRPPTPDSVPYSDPQDNFYPQEQENIQEEEVVQPKKKRGRPKKEETSDDDILYEASRATHEAAEEANYYKGLVANSLDSLASTKKELLEMKLRDAYNAHVYAKEIDDPIIKAEAELAISETKKQLYEHERNSEDIQQQLGVILNKPTRTIDIEPEDDEPSYYETENLTNFRKSNPWFDYESPHYQPSLAREATEVSQRLREELALTNQMNFIDTPEFYEEVRNRMYSSRGINPQNNSYESQAQPQQYQQQYPQQNYPQRQTAMTNSAPMTAPIRNGSVPINNRKQPQFNQDQFDIVSRVLENNVKRGGIGPLTEEQKIEIYKTVLQSQSNRRF